MTRTRVLAVLATALIASSLTPAMAQAKQAEAVNPAVATSNGTNAITATRATTRWRVNKAVGAQYKDHAKLWSNGLAITNINHGGKIAIRAKGDQCGGAPQVKVYVDRKLEGTFNIVNRTGAWDYPLEKIIPRGNHEIRVQFTNDHSRLGCDRNVYLYGVVPYKDMTNPLNVAGPYADPWFIQQTTTAAKATTGYDSKALAALSRVPTATWLGPWHPRGKVGPKVAETIAAAKKANRTPVFVIYGMYGCSGVSGGSIAGKDYFAWLGEIAWNLGNHRAVVILEPDALGLAGKGCPSNLTHLKGAVDALSYHKATYTYIDAGHAHWLKNADAVARLKAVGVNKVRGFSLNVANTVSDYDNRRYGNVIGNTLGKTFIIDTARNGRRSKVVHNPLDAAVGITPRAYAYGRQDASLWLKPPGESDGSFSGGPAAGQFWSKWAASMIRNAGWKL